MALHVLPSSLSCRTQSPTNARDVRMWVREGYQGGSGGTTGGVCRRANARVNHKCLHISVAEEPPVRYRKEIWNGAGWHRKQIFYTYYCLPHTTPVRTHLQCNVLYSQVFIPCETNWLDASVFAWCQIPAHVLWKEEETLKIMRTPPDPLSLHPQLLK